MTHPLDASPGHSRIETVGPQCPYSLLIGCITQSISKFYYLLRKYIYYRYHPHVCSRKLPNHDNFGLDSDNGLPANALARRPKSPCTSSKILSAFLARIFDKSSGREVRAVSILAGLSCQGNYEGKENAKPVRLTHERMGVCKRTHG